MAFIELLIFLIETYSSFSQIPSDPAKKKLIYPFSFASEKILSDFSVFGFLSVPSANLYLIQNLNRKCGSGHAIHF
jgi:hypothetical protein